MSKSSQPVCPLSKPAVMKRKIIIYMILYNVSWYFWFAKLWNKYWPIWKNEFIYNFYGIHQILSGNASSRYRQESRPSIPFASSHDFKFGICPKSLSNFADNALILYPVPSSPTTCLLIELSFRDCTTVLNFVNPQLF